MRVVVSVHIVLAKPTVVSNQTDVIELRLPYLNLVDITMACCCCHGDLFALGIVLVKEICNGQPPVRGMASSCDLRRELFQ